MDTQAEPINEFVMMQPDAVEPVDTSFNWREVYDDLYPALAELVDVLTHPLPWHIYHVH